MTNVSSPSPFDRFWAPPNEVDRQALNQELGELIAQLEGRISRGALRSILPAKVAGETRWYGFSPTDREQRMLAEELGAWLGPPISSGPRLVDNQGDELDQLAGKLAPGSQILRLNVQPPWRSTARNNVLRLTDLWDLAPEGEEDISRPVGRVLRQFYESIRSGARDRAEEAIVEIADRALLSPTNRRFLRVELLGSLGTPQELRDHPDIDGLTSVTLPPAVREHLAQAANSLYITPAANEAAPDWQSVGRSIESTWPALCDRIDQARSRVTARCLALYEALREAPRPDVIHHLGDEWGSDPVVSDVLSPLTPAEERDPLQQDNPSNAYERGDYLTVLQLVESDDLSIENVPLVLFAAANLDDVNAANRALTLVHALPEEFREEVLSVLVNRATYERLTERVGGTAMPTGWVEWLNGDWADRPDLLNEWRGNWGQIHEVTEDDGYEIALALVGALRSPQRGRVRNGLPIMVDWLRGIEKTGDIPPADPGEEEPFSLTEETETIPPGVVPILTIVVEAMLTVGSGPGERISALKLIDEVLSIGGTADEYARLLDALDSQLDELGPREAPWLFECLDVLLASSSTDPDRRTAFLGRALGVATGWGHRLNQTDALILEKAFGEGDLTFVSPTYDTAALPGEQTQRTFKRVGIYTLHERSGRTVERWIRETWPEVEVSLSSAHVRTDELVALARGADVILMQISRAKHMATEAIEDAISDPSRLVYVNGRGASAILKALYDWLTQ